MPRFWPPRQRNALFGTLARNSQRPCGDSTFLSDLGQLTAEPDQLCAFVHILVEPAASAGVELDDPRTGLLDDHDNDDQLAISVPEAVVTQTRLKNLARDAD